MRIADFNRPWLEPYTWDFVEQVNQRLCSARGADHKPTSDGFQEAKKLWEERFQKPMLLFDVASLCRESHRIAPFCFYNGNTFVAIIRDAIRDILERLSPEHSFVLRSALGHHVAGTISDEDLLNVIEDLPEIQLVDI